MRHFLSIKSLCKTVSRTLLAGLLALAVGGAFAVKAQTSADQSAGNLTTLLERLRLIDQDLKILNRVVFGNKKPPAPTTPKAETMPEATTLEATTRDLKAAADAEDRFTVLEEQIQNLTGILERFGHDIEQAGKRLNKLVNDVDFRLTAIERSLAAAKVAGAANPLGQTAYGATANAPQAIGDQLVSPAATRVVVSANAPGTNVLGVIPAGDVAPGAATGGAVALRSPAEPKKPKGVLPEGTVQERYKFAYDLVRRLRTAQAEVAFKEFLVAHGDDPLADNARYWLGESYYARRQYAQAADTFVTAYSKAPNGPKARDNLLKLGMSLSRLDQQESACESFDEMLSQFNSEADAKARKKAQSEKKRAGCN